MDRTGHGRWRQRYRIAEGDPFEAHELHGDGFGLVVATRDDPHDAEAALGCLLFGGLLVGVDWAEVLALAGDRRLGQARTVPGVFAVTDALIEARDRLTADGFGEGFVLVQLPAPGEWGRFELAELAALADALFAGIAAPALFTAATGWVRGRSVLIGFAGAAA